MIKYKWLLKKEEAKEVKEILNRWVWPCAYDAPTFRLVPKKNCTEVMFLYINTSNIHNSLEIRQLRKELDSKYQFRNI